MWLRDCFFFFFCSILGNSNATLYPSFKSQNDTETQKLRLIALTKEVSEMLFKDFVLCLYLMKNIWNMHNQLRKEKYKINSIKGGGAPGSEMVLNSEFKDIKLN